MRLSTAAVDDLWTGCGRPGGDAPRRLSTGVDDVWTTTVDAAHPGSLTCGDAVHRLCASIP